jgi:sugar lactone lactonase YvrE
MTARGEVTQRGGSVCKAFAALMTAALAASCSAFVACSSPDATVTFGGGAFDAAPSDASSGDSGPECDDRVDTTSDPANCGACGHDCQGGACIESHCQAFALYAGTAVLQDIAVDAENVYWTTLGTYSCPSDFCTYNGDGTVSRLPKGGGVPFDLASGQLRPLPIAVSSTNAFWANVAGGTIMTVPLGGGLPSVLASGQDPWSLALDATQVYWTNLSQGTVMSVPVAGGTPATLADGRAPVSIAVDATHLYWIDKPIWASSGSVMSLPKSGGAVNLLALAQDPSSMVVDGVNVYWTDAAQGSVSQLPKAGGAPMVLAVGQLAPAAIAVDSQHVYWANNAGTVMRVAIGGGELQRLAAGEQVAAIAVDAESIYWTTAHAVMKLAK